MTDSLLEQIIVAPSEPLWIQHQYSSFQEALGMSRFYNNVSWRQQLKSPLTSVESKSSWRSLLLSKAPCYLALWIEWRRGTRACFQRITAPPFFCLQGLSQHHCCNDTRECDASVANPADSLSSPVLGQEASEIWWINERLLMLIADIRLFRAPRQSLIFF